jgi:hypothetical protein
MLPSHYLYQKYFYRCTSKFPQFLLHFYLLFYSVYIAFSVLILHARQTSFELRKVSVIKPFYIFRAITRKVQCLVKFIPDAITNLCAFQLQLTPNLVMAKMGQKINFVR